MAVLEARIFASVYGTATELAASTKILGIGERWYRTDAPIVTDSTSPFYNLRDPAKQWKTGDGTKTWAQIVNYDPIGTGSTSGGGSVDINPNSVLANLDSESGPGASLKLDLETGDDPDTTVTLKSVLGALDSSDYSALVGLIGDVSEAESTTGGVRGVLNRFIATASIPDVVVTGNITTGSDIVTLATPLDTRITEFARVFVNSGGTGVPSPAYINSIATDRLSFRLTSSIFSFSSGGGTSAPATATGSRSFTIRDPSATVFGMSIDGILKQNVRNGSYGWRSTPNALSNAAISGETTETRIFNGVMYYRSAMVNAGAWEQMTGAVDLLLISRQVVASVSPTSHHTWATLPATAQEFLAETNGRHRFRLTIPDDSYTQFMLGIDNLIVAGTNTSTMWVEFLDTADTTGGAGGTWKDITSPRVTASLNTPIDTFKESALGTIVAAAKTLAAASPSRSVYCRIMAVTTGAATGNPQFTNVWTLVK